MPKQNALSIIFLFIWYNKPAELIHYAELPAPIETRFRTIESQ